MRAFNSKSDKLKALKKGNKQSKKFKEKLTDDEIKDLMGVYRDTYKRKNGAVRRK